jgi:hypothetical protein
MANEIESVKIGSLKIGETCKTELAVDENDLTAPV